MELTQEYLKSILIYDPETGVFRWKVYRSNRALKDAIAGCVNTQGYNVIRFNGQLWRAARLAYFYMTGEWPNEIDHINGITADDRWENIRNATSQENKRNRSININNNTGFKGVSHYGNRFKASLKIDYQEIIIGVFDTAKEAGEAYVQAAKERYGDYAKSEN